MAGKGAACYCTRTLTDDLARDVVVAVLNKEGMAMREELPESVVRMTRGPYVIIANYGNEPEEIPAESGKILLGEAEIGGRRMTVGPLGVVIFRK